MMVLHPAEVPDEPRDGVGARRGRCGELVHGEAVDGFVGQRADSSIDLEQESGDVHDLSPAQCATVVAWQTSRARSSRGTKECATCSPPTSTRAPTSAPASRSCTAAASVVDIWGGHIDEARTQPWQADTIINVWSTTKTMAALVCARPRRPRRARPPRSGVPLLAGVRGQRQGERRGAPPPVAHRRLVAVGKSRCNRRPLRLGQGDVACSPRRSRGGSRAPRPATTPSRRAISSVRSCAGSTGATIGRFFADEIAGPLGADFHIGTGRRARRPSRAR